MWWRLYFFQNFLLYKNPCKGSLNQRQLVPLLKRHADKHDRPAENWYPTASTICCKVSHFFHFLQIYISAIFQASIYICIYFWITFFLCFQFIFLPNEILNTPNIIFVSPTLVSKMFGVWLVTIKLLQ